MSTEHHPLHSEDVRQAVGSPAVNDEQPPPGRTLSSLLEEMDFFFITFSGPPYSSSGGLFGYYYPYYSYFHQYPYRSYNNTTWYPLPLPPVPTGNQSFYQPVMHQMTPRYVCRLPRRPPPPPRPPYVRDKPTLQPLPLESTEGAFKQIETLDTQIRLHRNGPSKDNDYLGPPDINDETVFPSLERKEIHLKTREEKVFENPLQLAIERKFQPKIKAGPDHSGVVSDMRKNWPPECTSKVAIYQVEPLWRISRSSRGLGNKEVLFQHDFGLHSSQLHRYLLRYVPPRNRLEELGYPVVSLEDTTKFTIFKKPLPYTQNNWQIDWVKPPLGVCDRCFKIFYMNPGMSYHQPTCVYHWGQPQYGKDSGSYTCCGQPPNTPTGCTTANSHVWSGLNYGLNTDLKGFVRTAFTNPNRCQVSKVFGLDCEMCYTTEGFELVKVALVDLAGNQVYCSLVYPEHEVIDFNTRFSGVSEIDYLMSQAKRFKEVQLELLKLIENDTIIIGHALENDLRALKIVHSLVVDTSIVYSNYQGVTGRRKLKDLAQEVLGKKIQEGGHNPVEDANVCVELILKKLAVDFDIRIISEVED